MRNFHRAESGGLVSGLLPLAQASPFSETCFPIERKASGSSVLLAPDILVSVTSLAPGPARHWASGEACGHAQGCPVASRLACRGWGACGGGEGLPLTLLLRPLTRHTVCSLLGGPVISVFLCQRPDRGLAGSGAVLTGGPAGAGKRRVCFAQKGCQLAPLGPGREVSTAWNIPLAAWPDP